MGSEEGFEDCRPYSHLFNESASGLRSIGDKRFRHTQPHLVCNCPLVWLVMGHLICFAWIYPITWQSIQHPAHCLRCLAFSEGAQRRADDRFVNIVRANSPPPTSTCISQIYRPVQAINDIRWPLVCSP